MLFKKKKAKSVYSEGIYSCGKRENEVVIWITTPDKSE